MIDVAILGCGGHGRSLGDILFERLARVVYIDDDPKGFAVVGNSNKLNDREFLQSHEIVIGIGDNKLRQYFSGLVVGNGGRVMTVSHPMASIARTAMIGRGCQFFPFSIVAASARIDDYAIINNKSSVAHDCHIGEAAQVADGATLAGRVVVGKRTLIGVGATVLPGIKIGDDCIIGAGAVVTRDVARGSVVKGCPAR